MSYSIPIDLQVGQDLDLNYGPLMEDIPPDAKILDYGCGVGRMCVWLQNRGFKNLTAVDTLPENLASVRQHAPGTKTFCYSSPHLLEREGPYDLIFLKDSLIYFSRERLPSVIRAFRELLVPGGRLLIQIPNAASYTGGYSMAKDLGIQWTASDWGLEILLINEHFLEVKTHAFKNQKNTLKRWLFYTAQSLWFQILRGIYYLERGEDFHRARHMGTRIIVEARR